MPRGSRSLGPRRAAIVAAVIWCALAARLVRAFVSAEAWGVSDDIYISAAAARSLFEGYGPAWYPGAPAVEGFSNPLWVGVLAGLHALPGFHEDALGGWVLGVNLLLLVALAFACVRALRAIGFERWGDWLWLVPTAVALPYFAAEGFEVVMIALLGVLALDAAWRRKPIRFALWVGLGFWTRMDFLVLAALPGVGLALQCWRDRRFPKALALGAAMVAALLWARWSFFGEWLPNPAVLKMTGWPLTDRVARGLSQNAWAWPSTAVLLLGSGVLYERVRSRAALLCAGCVATFAVGLAYSTWVGGDFLLRRGGWDRFTAPYLPLLSIGLATGLGAIGAPAVRKAVLAALIGVLMIPVLATQADRKTLDRRLVNLHIDAEPQRWALGLRGLGKAYEAVSLPGARMAVCAAGSVIYFSHRGGVDLLGKVDPAIAALPVTGPPTEERCWRDWPGHNKEDIGLSFELHSPDFSAVPPPQALRDQYRPVRYDGHEFWVRRGTPYARWDRL